MAESSASLLALLIELSRLDVLHTGISIERKRLQSALVESEAALKRDAVVVLSKQRALEDRRNRYNQAERSLKDERQKLVDRRKALTTLSNYKLQQAAEREIEHASETLSTQETTLIKMLEEIDSMAADFTKVESAFKAEREAFDRLREETAGTFQTLDRRQSDYDLERQEVAKKIEPGALSQYNRIKDRFPMGAVAKVEQNTCAGCFMQVGPQIVVQIARGNALVRCPGCGRILYQENEPAKAAEG